MLCRHPRPVRTSKGFSRAGRAAPRALAPLEAQAMRYPAPRRGTRPVRRATGSPPTALPPSARFDWDAPIGRRLTLAFAAAAVVVVVLSLLSLAGGALVGWFAVARGYLRVAEISGDGPSTLVLGIIGGLCLYGQDLTQRICQEPRLVLPRPLARRLARLDRGRRNRAAGDRA